LVVVLASDVAHAIAVDGLCPIDVPGDLLLNGRERAFLQGELDVTQREGDRISHRKPAPLLGTCRLELAAPCGQPHPHQRPWRRSGSRSAGYPCWSRSA